MLHILFSEEVLRGIAIDLLKTEKDEQLITVLKDLATDDSLEGTESQKNKFLAPAPAVPKLDREIAEAAGKKVGLEPISTVLEKSPPDKVVKPDDKQNTKSTASSLYRSVSQDELMGYDDSDDYF